MCKTRRMSVARVVGTPFGKAQKSPFIDPNRTDYDIDRGCGRDYTDSNLSSAIAGGSMYAGMKPAERPGARGVR